MRSSELDYHLPEALIAQHPVDKRPDSRLLVVNRSAGTLQDLVFSDLAEALRSENILVINNTRVLPGRFFLRRRTGGRIEGLWLGSDRDGTWNVLLRGASRVQPDEVLSFEESPSGFQARVIARQDRGAHRLSVTPPQDAATVLGEVGMMPLPPYIKRRDRDHECQDRQRYQTVYARRDGAIAAPTAGLHFDRQLLARLEAQAVRILEVTLHVGWGTFQPIEVDDLNDHRMHVEGYEVSPENWAALTEVRQQGRQVTAVGTTSARVLETVAHNGLLKGETKLFIYPPYRFHMVDALITNFHLPGSTLLAMIYAFGGTELVRKAYAHAIQQKYRFYSYGDAMLIV